MRSRDLDWWLPGRSGLGWGPLGSGRISSSTAAVVEPPFASKNTFGLGGEEVEESFGEIETTPRATRALVHDLSRGGFSVVGHSDRLETVGARVSTTELSRVQCDDEVTWVVKVATRTHSDVIEGPTSTAEAFVNADIGVGTTGERIMVATVTVFSSGESSKKRDRQ